MTKRLFKLFTCRIECPVSVVNITYPYLQSALSKGNQNFNCELKYKRSQFSTGSSILIMLFFLILSVQSKAQITDITTFPLNEYLYTPASNPYPLVNNDKINAIDKSRFVNVMDYGAKGDGVTLDDAAIANAFKAAQYGVIFPSGKTFLVSKTTKITLTHDLTVCAYGATIKMAAFSRYSFLSLEYQSGSYHNKVIWLGGTLDGNQKNQSWPGSPTGNNTWEEAHGRFVGVSYAEFALFKDINLINTVVDGIGIESCKLGVIADSKASGGAPIVYSGVEVQGTYFKFTRVGLKVCYFINLSCDGGSIGTHVSYPEKSTMDNQTLSVHNNCHFYNQVQNAVHIEDCYKNFFYNCTIGADTSDQYHPSLHLSNRTGIVSIKNCQFTNSRVNFNNASSLKLGIIDSCQFVSTFKSFVGTSLRTFIEGRPTICYNSTFKGLTAYRQAEVKNLRRCTFTDFDSLGVWGAYAVDSCTFTNGKTAANLAKNGFVINSQFTNVKNSTYKKQSINDDWKKTFMSYIDIFSDTKNYLGRIAVGSGATQNKSYATASVNTTAKSQSNLTAKSINLYPNPAVEEVHVTLNDQVSGKTALNIYDQQGRLVKATTVEKNTSLSVETIKVNNLTAGSYILQIVNDNYKSSFKFIIAK